MQLSKDEKVHTFLSDLKSVDSDMFDIFMDTRNILFKTHPKIEEKIMYGGIIFSLGADMFGGLFAYKKHISLEFSKGFQLKDPNNYLEGKGKFRRHLKLLKRADVGDKEVEFYVKQVL